jgi:hypothetical protein
MIRVRGRLSAALIASGLFALLAPFSASAAAAQQPIGQPVPPVAGAQQRLTLEVTKLTPRVVTSATPDITVEAKVTNTGDLRIDRLQVRLQRGEAVSSDNELRNLHDQKTDTAGPFQDVTRSLEPGDSADLSVTIPVTGQRGTLRIDEPGVYPLLVNVNGRPDASQQARLAAVSIPMAVMSVPGGPAATPKAQPPDVTMLWPLLDKQPRRLPTTDGGRTTLLSDDDLATSLGVGGRLFNLVNALTAVAQSDAELLRSMCFVVDPDLLETVAAMSQGYQVRRADGQVVTGKGTDVASDWLGLVRDLTNGRCVVAVPYADADLASLSRAGAADLAQLALAGSSVVKELLSVQALPDVYWPAGGTFDKRTLIDLANASSAAGATTVLADPGHLQRVEGRAPYTVNVGQTARPVRALPVDSLVSDALAGPGSAGLASGTSGESVQNGLAALAYRAAFDRRDGGAVLVAPPRRWLASHSELTEFLTLAKELFDGGFTTAQSLDQVVAAPEGGTAQDLEFNAQDDAQEIPTQVTAEVMRINATKRDMLDSMADDNTNAVDPNALLSPIQYGLLRGMSTAWRGQVQGAVTTVEFVDEQLSGLRDLVVVANPGRPLSLASGDSPILVTVNNGLPVTIVVRLNVSPAPGLRTEQVEDFKIPPLSSGRRLIPAEVSRSGRFSVDVRLSTPGGTPLGEPVRLELNSTSYGIISVALTGTAGVVLVLLVGFRIFRRVKAARAGDAKTEEIVEGSLRSDHGA